MILRDYEVMGDKIILDKKELESWRDHYKMCTDRKSYPLEMKMYYASKADLLMDILKKFEENEE